VLTVVDVFGLQPDVHLSLPFAGAEDEPIQIKDVKGLEPVKAAISTSPYGVIQGEAITGTSIGKRNIVLTLGLNPDWAEQTVEALRLLLYRYFMPQLPVTLRFTSTHLPTCQIDGVVEDMQPNIFAKDPEYQISVICGRPEFTSIEESVVNGTVDTTLDAMVEIDYEGSAPTGMVVLVQYSSSRATYTGELTAHAESLLYPSTDFVLGEVTIEEDHAVQISSVPGDKYVHTVSDPVENLLVEIQSGYEWPMLYPGQNKFQMLAELDGQRWRMTYFTKFGGL
jgi:hypothetical protein